jgi:glycosyltransferase involved in cell wall biosynthesis
MRILFVTNRYPTPQTPGDSPCIAQQRAAIEKLGHIVDVLFIHSQKSWFRYLTAVGKLFWSSRRYDVIHAHYGSFCGLVAGAQMSTPVIVTFRGSDVFHKREYRLSRWAAWRAAQVVVMSREMKERLGRQDAHVIPYGIDLEQFQPRPQAAARRALGLPENVPLVLFPYDPARTVKRFDLVRAAIDLAVADFPQIDVVAIDSKPYASIPDYMNACDALVLTSDSEGAPVAVREAMACNLPIVSVDVGDVRDVMGDTAGCHLVTREPHDIAAKIGAVIRSRSRTNGRTAMAQMSIDCSAAQVVRIYETLARTRSRPPPSKQRWLLDDQNNENSSTVGSSTAGSRQ